ncbi:MAG: hypothetical protein ABMA64_05215 [Myxococcota bacterium]
MIGWWIGTASAGTLGLGGALVLDRPDTSDQELVTRLGPGFEALVPYRYPLGPIASLRVTGAASFAAGDGLVTALRPGIGTPTDVIPMRTLMVAGTVGPEIRLMQQGGVIPYLTGGVGLAGVVAWFAHADHPEWFDPTKYDQDDLDDRTKPGLHTRTIVPTSNLAVGAHLGEGWVELGYELSFLDRTRLRRSSDALEPTREAFGWNAIRIGAGYTFEL